MNESAASKLCNHFQIYENFWELFKVSILYFFILRDVNFQYNFDLSMIINKKDKLSRNEYDAENVVFI